jgi:hypothetical protein
MKNLVSGFIFIMTIAFALGSCEVPTDSGTTTVIPKIYDNTVETPVASPAAGLVAENEKVTLSTATKDAAIYYTEDGTDPTEESILYESPITIDEDKTIKAVAVKEG